MQNFKMFQASAGSGKTYTIVKEYLKLCLGSPKQVDNFRHILAITFTNASANDMKAKIINHLNDIIESKTVKEHTMESDLIEELGIGDEELKRNAQTLRTRIIHDYSSFCVSTIDAFVQKLSRSFAHDLGLPNQYTVSIDNDDIAHQRRQSFYCETVARLQRQSFLQRKKHQPCTTAANVRQETDGRESLPKRRQQQHQ